MIPIATALILVCIAVIAIGMASTYTAKLRNPRGGRGWIEEGISQAGPSSYNDTTGIVLTFANLKSVVQVKHLSITGGYKIVPVSKTGNTVTVEIHFFDNDAVADSVSIEIPNTTDIDAETIEAVALGA